MTRRGLILTALLPRRRGMVRLPGGAFRMGSDENSLLRQFPNAGPGLKAMLLAETPPCDVTLPPFWIDRCEVTNAEFQRFVRARPEWGKGNAGAGYLRHWSGGRYPAGQADLPVTFVTWHAALAYAQWGGRRLPTEAEWEFAARGGRVNATYPWGDAEPNPRLANYAASGLHAPVRPGSYPPNPYGLFDLAGNVWEFCLDEWKERRTCEARPQSGPDLERTRVSRAERRVIRGGSFDGGAFNMRVAARDSHRVNDPAAHVGFRCAMSAWPAAFFRIPCG